MVLFIGSKWFSLQDEIPFHLYHSHRPSGGLQEFLLASYHDPGESVLSIPKYLPAMDF